MKITVVQPTNIFVDLEKAIEERFGIRQAIVVDVGENASYSQVKHAIGSAAAHSCRNAVAAGRPRGDLVLEQYDPLHGG